MREGYITNPDDEFVSNLKKRIKANSKYCLNKEKGNQDNRCPCRAFREGEGCECGMYIKDPSSSFDWGDGA